VHRTAAFGPLRKSNRAALAPAAACDAGARKLARFLPKTGLRGGQTRSNMDRPVSPSRSSHHSWLADPFL